MFGWIRKLRRRRIKSRPFPSAWETFLRETIGNAADLSEDQLRQVRQAVQILVAEKNWEGCGGLVLEDEHRVTIATQIGRMMLGFPGDYFDEILSILVYPDAYIAQGQQYMGSGVVMEHQSGRLGEAWYRGPVVLAWSDIESTVLGRNYGRNVVIHEFAHQLDMRNGRFADGIPPIESAEDAADWLQVLERDFDRLQRECRMGSARVLDCYGASSTSEFFAVASEAFFEAPQDLKSMWPDLHWQLTRIYRQEP